MFGGIGCWALGVFSLFRLFLVFQTHHAAPASSSVPKTLPMTTPAIVPAGVPALLFEDATVTVAGEGGDCDVVDAGRVADGWDELVACGADVVDSVPEMLK